MGAAAAANGASKVGELTTRIKQAVLEYASKQNEAHTAHAALFSLSYQWVQAALLEGRAETTEAAIIKLASTVKRTVGTVQRWYYLGVFMAENRLTVRHNVRGIKAVYSANRRLTKYELTRCLDMIRDGTSARDIHRVIAKSKAVHAAEAERKAEDLDRTGKLTRTRLRMEMMALLTMARKFYKSETVAVQVWDGGKMLDAV